MKIGLFIALLVVLASTDVFGQKPTRRPVPPNKPETDETDTGVPVADKAGAKTTTVITSGQTGSGPTKTTVQIETGGQPSDGTTVVHSDSTPDQGEGRRKPTASKEKDDTHAEPEPERTTTKPRPIESNKPVLSGDGDIVSNVQTTRPPRNDKPVLSGDGDVVSVVVDTKPLRKEKPEKHDDDDGGRDVIPVQPELHKQPVVGEINPLSQKNRVHVSGSISLIKYRSSVVDTVQYDLDGGRLTNGGRPLWKPTVQFAQDFLARESRVTLYVSTSKTTNPKLAFAQFPIDYTENHFPITFDLDVDLPFQQRGLIESADITLYFFVYIRNYQTRMDTFVPAGTSQILLQGTNRLVQRLDVFVRANGIEVAGLFRGRFGNSYIRPGTSLQVLVIPENSLRYLQTAIFESVAQLTLTDVPAMFPVPFSLLVQQQMLKPDTKYYAIAYVFENGVRRLINQKPVYVITEQTVPLSVDIVFNVVPSPFILQGTVTRSMPNLFSLQPDSKLVIRIRDTSSNSEEIKFTLSNLISLPQDFAVNISQSDLFDPSADYEVGAFITDGKNSLYMGSLHPVQLLDQPSRLIVPVDDFLYYVQVHLHSSSNYLISYMPGSRAQIFVAETPEVLTKPIVALQLEVTPGFREFSIQIPSTSIQRDRSYYLVIMIENNGVITHLSKTLLISNNQPPPPVIQLPVLSINSLTGVIVNSDNTLEAQWSSSSYASLYLLDDTVENAEKAVVQIWKIHLEKSFPVRFEVQVDFSRIRPNRAYRLQATIDNGRGLLEYKPAISAIAIRPDRGLLSDIRVSVENAKTYQLISGLVYIDGIRGPLPDHGEVIVQLSTKSSLSNPDIIDTIRIKVDGRKSPLDFEMKLSLKEHNINDVYYFLVQYVVRDNVIIPISQAFAFSPRNQATVVITLSKTPQIPITGQVTSTGSALSLPSGATLHLYITDNFNPEKPMIYSEVFLKATPNSLFEFTMNIDSLILQRKYPLYLRADILYNDIVILSMPRPALLQITPGGEWNINLVVDLPTLVVGQVVSLSRQEGITGEFDVFIQVIQSGSTEVIHTARVRLTANLPQGFRIELENSLFVRHPSLEIRAVIKNCKGQVLFESAGSVGITTGLNVDINLPVVLTDRQKFAELQNTINEVAPVHIGEWHLSVVGMNSETKPGEGTLNNNFVLEQP